MIISRGGFDVARTCAPWRFPHCVTLVYASTLVGSELPELGDIARLVVKSLGKRIDEHLNQKGYTESLAREKFSALRLVDDDVVNILPGGSNWRSSPLERLNLVLGLCDAKKIVVQDTQRLREAMLGNGAARRSTSTGTDGIGGTDGNDERRSYTTYTTYTTQTEEYTDGGDVYGTPTSKLVDPAGKKKKPTWKQGKKKKKSGGSSDGMETWQMFMAQKSPASSGPGSEGGTAGGRRSSSGWAEPGLGGSRGEDDDDDDDVLARPGWSPPKPKFEGNGLSFGPRLDNVANYIAKRRSSES